MRILLSGMIGITLMKKHGIAEMIPVFTGVYLILRLIWREMEIANAEETERQKAKNLRCKKTVYFCRRHGSCERITEWIIMVTDNMVDL